MIRRPAPRFRRVGPDRFAVKLPRQEQEVLRDLTPQLRGLLVTDDPSLRRLFPTAYANDPERDAGYQALVRDELIERRMAALDELDAIAGGGEVDGDRLGAVMRACNDLRLVLGTRLDVGEDDLPEDLDPRHPDAGAWAVYHYLGMLVAFIVEALAEDLPEGDDTDAPSGP